MSIDTVRAHIADRTLNYVDRPYNPPPFCVWIMYIHCPIELVMVLVWGEASSKI